ncbi:MAG: tetratricopeptide repeat protein [Chloracidobacterium sp.]|nr:tetratricopeptide repeat protein [Chloracidobacterium sp.]
MEFRMNSLRLSCLSRKGQHGFQYLSSKDKQSKKAAERALQDAEKQVKAILKRSANCEKCHELITHANFLQAYFGFSKDYDDTIESAKNGLQKFPNNGRLVYLLGYAEFNTGKFADANKSLKAALLNADQNTANEINAVLQKSQQAFLTGWNRHANFYQSNESRILRYNPSTYRYEVAFQVTPEFEYQLGAQGLMALMSNARPLNDPEIQQYVENLVTRIVSKSPGSNFSYRVTIVDSDEVNAMTRL